MNKKLLVGVVVLLLLVGGAYFLSNKKDSEITPTSQNASSETSTNSNAGSLGELFAGAGGPSKTCTFENTTASGKASGVIYTGENKVRGDFSVEAGGKLTESHMIVMDNTSYIWQDGQKSGIKATFGEENLKMIEPEEAPDSDDDSDVESPEGKYECKDWSVNSSFFDLPKGVEFTSTASMMQPESEDGEDSTEGSNSNCSVCNSLSGEQKTQCLTALKCS